MTRSPLPRVTGRLTVALACLLAWGPVAPLAVAAPEADELSQARAKFQQATELEQAGNFASALRLFREVGQVRMTPQVRFHIALCEEKLGKLVAALGGYELALSEADAMGPDFKKTVEDRSVALRERIPKVIIERGQGAEAATVELDGVSLGASSIGVEVPVDPGPHTVAAEAPGYTDFTTTISVPEKETETVSITLEKIAEGTVASPTSDKGIAPAAPPANKHPRLVPYAVGGAGIAALAVSGVFFILQRNKDSELQDLCGKDHDCDNSDPRPLTAEEKDAANNMYSKLKTYSTVAQVSAVGGIVAIGVAGVLLLTEPKPQGPTATTGLFLAPAAPGADLAGLSFNSRF